MKLLIRTQQEAEALAINTRFLRWDYPHKLVVSIPEGIDLDLHQEFITVSKPTSEPSSLDNAAFLSLESATDTLGNAPLIFFTKAVALLYIPQGSAPGDHQALPYILDNSECYVFTEDRSAIEFMAGVRFHSIVYPGCLLRDNGNNKLLITSNYPALLALLYSAGSNYACLNIFGSKFIPNLTLELSEPKNLDLQRMLLLYASLEPFDAPCFRDLRRTITLALEKQNSSYSIFASYYDAYMAHVDYDLWISRILDWQQKYSSLACKRILELACGTANVSQQLMMKGYEVDASDLSTSMLHVASTKIHKPNLSLASMTDPIPKRDYDLILCMFDSINYLLDYDDILMMFANAHEALASQGLFIFDISTLLNSLENFADVCNLTEDSHHVLIHEARYEPHHRRQISELNDFVFNGISYTRRKEKHNQRVYMNEELLRIINQSQLQLVAIHSTEHKANLYPRKMQRIDTEHYRLFYVLQKA